MRKTACAAWAGRTGGRPLEGFRHAEVHYSSFDPVEVTRVMLDSIGGKDALSVTRRGPEGARGRPTTTGSSVMLMNLWMPPCAEPKNRAQARRRREVVAAPVPHDAAHRAPRRQAVAHA